MVFIFDNKILSTTSNGFSNLVPPKVIFGPAIPFAFIIFSTVFTSSGVIPPSTNIIIQELSQGWLFVLPVR
jgi:hypothetical protein